MNETEFRFWSEAAFAFIHNGLSAEAAAAEADKFLLLSLRRSPGGIPSVDHQRQDFMTAILDRLASLVQTTGPFPPHA